MKRLLIFILALSVLAGCTKEEPPRIAFPVTVGKPRHLVETPRDTTKTKADEPAKTDTTKRLKRGVNVVRL